jgi:hypothetical protein
VTIQDVVAYKTNGHMYFLEDGGEHNNTFDHNLGAVAYPVPDGDIPSPFSSLSVSSWVPRLFLFLFLLYLSTGELRSAHAGYPI